MTAKFPYRPANKFHEGIKARFEAVDETSQSIKLLTGAVRKVADAVQSLGMRDKDNVTALYAAAVDTTGDIVDRTNAGQWLNSAKFKKLRDLVKFRKDEPQAIRRQDFVDKMRAAPPISTGLPAVVTDDDLARFFELAPAVQKAIDDSQPTPSGQLPLSNQQQSSTKKP